MSTPEPGFGAAVLDRMDCAVAVLGPDRTLRYVNQRWRDFSSENGGPADGFLGSDYLAGVDIIANKDLAVLAKSMDSIMNGDLDRFRFEYPCDAPGERRWYVMKASGYDWPDGRGVIIAHVQVATANVDGWRALREETDTEKAADVLKDRVLRLITHQFRTPMSVLATDLMTIARDLEPDDPRAQRARRNLRRLERIVENGADLLRIETASALQRQPRPAIAALEACIRAVDTPNGSVQVTHEGRDPILAIDLAWMGRMVAELIRNAVQHGSGGVRAHIQGGEGVTLRVEDDGPGFDAALRPFEVPAETENLTSGAGLGLALARRIAEQHGGHLKVVPADHGVVEMFLPGDPGSTRGPRPSRSKPLATTPRSR